MKNPRTYRIIRRILLILVILILVLFSAGYLWQHYYGEKWVKQYIESRIAKESDSLYTLSIKELSMNLIAGRLTITGFELIPDTVRYRKMKEKGHVPPFLLHVKVEKLRVRGFETVRAIRSKDIHVSRILIDGPEVHLLRMSLPDTVIKDTVQVARSLSLKIPAGLNSVLMETLRISKGKFIYTDYTQSPRREFNVPELELEVTNFSQSKDQEYEGRLFNSDEIRVALRGLGINTPDSLYNVALGSISISSRNHEIKIDSLRVRPLVTREAYFKKLGYQTDIFNVAVDSVKISGLDYPAILLNNIVHTRKVQINGLNINVYRDKRYELRPGFQPKLPQQALRELKFLLTVDSVQLTSGRAEYEEQVGSEPGKISFEKLSGEVVNLSSDSAVWKKGDMVVRGSGLIMGKGQLNAVLTIPIGSKNNSFTFSGTVGAMDLTAINPMLTKLFPAKITSGNIDKLTIMPVTANNDFSKGQLEFRYTNLTMELEKDQDATGWQNFKTGVLNVAANTFVANSNPNKSGVLKPGIVYFNRDKRKGIFNFLWKSIFSGVKSTIGINNKEQKETKKVMKQDKKEAKKEKKEKEKEEKKEKKKNRQ